MALQQGVERLAIDAVHAKPRPAARDDVVEHRAIESAPFGGNRTPVDGEALGLVDRLAHALHGPAEISARSLYVEGQRRDRPQAGVAPDHASTTAAARARARR